MNFTKRNTAPSGLAIVAFLGLVIAFLAVGPYFTIKSINTLAGATVIPFGFWTWCAMAWPTMLAYGIAKNARPEGNN